MSNTLIFIVIGIVVVFIILRFVAKTLFYVLGLVVILGGIAYGIWKWQEQALPEGEHEILIYQLEEQYCNQQEKEVVCNCIIQPVIDAFETRYSAEEQKAMKKSDLKAMRAVLTILADKRQSIRQCLREHGALDEWDKFKEELKDQKMPEGVQQVFGN